VTAHLQLNILLLLLNEANTALVCLLTSFDGVEFKSAFFAFFDSLFRGARFRLVFA
jgi:hypothetical protein